MRFYTWERETPVQVEGCGHLWRVTDGKREWVCVCQYEDRATIVLGLILVDTQRDFEARAKDDIWRTK